MKKFLIRVGAIGVTGLAAMMLTACNSAKSGPGAASAFNSKNNYAARPRSLAAEKNWSLAVDGKRINPMQAPSNQSYYFGFNLSGMRPEDLSALNVQANYLAAHPDAHIRLTGNTDNRGSREYNIALGWRRDQAVARFLEQRGVMHGQIQMISYGKEHPLAQGNNPRAWGLNRRVDLKYTS